MNHPVSGFYLRGILMMSLTHWGGKLIGLYEDPMFINKTSLVKANFTTVNVLAIKKVKRKILISKIYSY